MNSSANSTNTTPTKATEAAYSGDTVTAPSSTFVGFVLAQLRCAALRSKIVTNQIEMAATALSAGMITPEMAILFLAETRQEQDSPF